MKRSALLLTGITLMVAATGCCGWPAWHGGAYRGGCPTGNCGPGNGPAVIPQGAYYQNYGSAQTAHIPAPVPDPIASAPIYQQSNYRPVALAPLNPLPTY